MIIDTSIKVANYKCFGEEPQGFEKIYPINIIIGKNNVGKSSLIDLVEYSSKPYDDFFNKERNRSETKVIIKKYFIIDDINNDDLNRNIEFYNTQRSASMINKYVLNDLEENKNRKIKYLLKCGESKIVELSSSLPPIFINDYFSSIKPPFQSKIVKRINADRDINPEIRSSNTEINPNGKGATDYIWRYLSLIDYNQNLIYKSLLTNLNAIAKPEIDFTTIKITENKIDGEITNIGEIYFEDANGTWVALSNMGSGIKTIILVLLNLLVIPDLKIEIKNRGNQSIKKEIQDFIFCFEELENNLHPSLQRRLFNFIAKFSQENQVYFFITTHSHIVIDMFSNNSNAQILHVRREGKYSVVDTVISDDSSRKVLKDLDYKASDMLLSNGIIWVEGPSDAIYIELFLELYKKSIGQEHEIKFSYSIQVLATAIWKYAGFEGIKWDEILENNLLENKVIALQDLNHNHLLVIDKDNNYELNKKPSEWNSFTNGTGKNKARLILKSLEFAQYNENNLIGKDYSGSAKVNEKDILLYWINEGTMETYLEHFVTNKSANEFSKYFKAKSKQHYFSKKEKGKDSSISKVELAGIIADYVRNKELSFEDIAGNDSDLKNKISRLYNTIKFWNE